MANLGRFSIDRWGFFVLLALLGLVLIAGYIWGGTSDITPKTVVSNPATSTIYLETPSICTFGEGSPVLRDPVSGEAIEPDEAIYLTMGVMGEDEPVCIVCEKSVKDATWALPNRVPSSRTTERICAECWIEWLFAKARKELVPKTPQECASLRKQLEDDAHTPGSHTIYYPNLEAFLPEECRGLDVEADSGN